MIASIRCPEESFFAVIFRRRPADIGCEQFHRCHPGPRAGGHLQHQGSNQKDAINSHGSYLAIQISELYRQLT
jgi:hypothetical protein